MFLTYNVEATSKNPVKNSTKKILTPDPHTRPQCSHSLYNSPKIPVEIELEYDQNMSAVLA